MSSCLLYIITFCFSWHVKGDDPYSLICCQVFSALLYVFQRDISFSNLILIFTTHMYHATFVGRCWWSRGRFQPKDYFHCRYFRLHLQVPEKNSCFLFLFSNFFLVNGAPFVCEKNETETYSGRFPDNIIKSMRKFALIKHPGAFEIVGKNIQEWYQIWKRFMLTAKLNICVFVFMFALGMNDT